MYDHYPNEGMRNLREFADDPTLGVEWKVFDVRGKGEVPSMNFDIFLSSGGPGSPYDGNGKPWEKDYFELVDKIWAHNQNGNPDKKYFFAICHSFQLLARHFKLGNVCKRKSTAFGVFPVHKTENARNDKFFRHLPEPFFAVDSRDWQLIEPDFKHLGETNAMVLSIEKRRDHVPLERAVMAVRLGNEFYMTQFHPEADAEGMIRYFAIPEKREHVIKNYGTTKLEDMIDCLSDPNKIPLTQKALIPAFLKNSLDVLRMQTN